MINLKKIYTYYFAIILLGVFVLNNSCRKVTVSDSDVHSTFYKVFPMPYHQLSGFVKQTKDGGFLMLGSDDQDGYGYLVTLVSKTDASGKLLWQKKVWIQNTISYSRVLGLNNGNYLIIGEEGDFVIMYPEGDLLIDKQFLYPFNYYLPGIPSEVNNKYYEGFTNGWQTSDDNNWIATISKTGAVDYLQLKNAAFGAYVLSLNVYNVSSSSATETNYWICGQVFENGSLNPSARVKFYAARFKNNKSEKVSIFNYGVDSVGNDYLQSFTGLPDTTLIAVTGDVKPNPVIHILQYDKDINLRSNKSLNLTGNNVSIKKIKQCRDGGFVLVGSTLQNNIYEQPLLVKLDKNANLLWLKYFPGKLNGTATFVDELSDGSFIITGNTSSFGNVNPNNDMFLIKTDANGNVN